MEAPALPCPPHGGAAVRVGRRHLWCAALLVAVGSFAWLNSFQGVFVYDDISQIVENEKIHSVQRMWRGRPVANLTFALNYRLGGLDVSGYHLVNLAVHLLAGLTLYGVVRRTLLLERFGGRFAPSAHLPALAVALVWLVHPLQTESVTYIVQRAESLMALFYLLVIYGLVRGACSRRPGPWYGAAVAACMLGMGCKPVIATAPLVALLFDRAYLAASWGEALRRRWGLYAGLTASWLVLVATGTAANVLETEPGLRRTAGFGYAGCTPLQYALTQPGVILHYLRLAFWPHPLVLDYDWPMARVPASFVAPGLAVAGLVAGALWAYRRRPAAGFPALSFFVLLAPTSSIVPFAHAAFEHRMYLPLACVAVLVVLGAHLWLGHLWRGLGAAPAGRAWTGGGLLAAVVVGLGLRTIDRNRDYRSEFEIWADVMVRRPSNPLPYNQIGNILTEMGRYEQAMGFYEQALRLRPDTFFIEDNLANVLMRAGRVDEAIDHGRRAVAMRPDYHRAHMNLGMALTERGSGPAAREGDFDGGIAHLREAVSLAPGDPWGHANLARGLALRSGLLETAGPGAPGPAAPRRPELVAESIAHFVEAIRLRPGFPEATTGLAELLVHDGDIDGRLAPYPPEPLRRARSLAWLRRGDRLVEGGETVEAGRAYERALEADPGNVHAARRLEALRGPARVSQAGGGGAL